MGQFANFLWSWLFLSKTLNGLKAVLRVVETLEPKEFLLNSARDLREIQQK